MVTLAIDVETNARDVRSDPLFRVLGVSYANSEGVSGYIHIGRAGKDSMSMAVLLRELFSYVDGASRYVFHNAKFDLLCLHRIGIDLYHRRWYDTLLMAHFLDENLPNKSLDYLGKLYFNEGKERDEKFVQFVECFGWEFLPQWMLEPYAIQDAKLTLRLFEYLYPKFVKEGFDDPPEKQRCA